MGVAVVNWKRAADTVECLASLAAGDKFDLDVVVVDNGSGDGSAEEIARKCPHARVIALERNEGYVVGINTAITEALRGDPEFILVMNNDAVATPGYLEPLVDIMDRRPHCGIAGSKILYYDSGRIWFGGGSYNRWLGYTKHDRMDEEDVGQETERRVDYITGCTALVRAEVFRRVGLYDEDFAMYFEDLDLCLRAEALGYESWYVPASVTRHKVSASAGIAGSNVLTPFRAYYYARNAMLLIGKDRRGLGGITSALGQFLVALPYYSLGILTGPTKGALLSYLKGLGEGTLWLVSRGV